MSKSRVTLDDFACRLSNLASLAYLAVLGAATAEGEGRSADNVLYISAAFALREDLEELASEIGATPTKAVA